MEGSGWAILVWVPRSGRLEILQSTLHQLFTQWDTIPLLVLDVWNMRIIYNTKIEKMNILKLVECCKLAGCRKRFESAKQIEWTPY